MPTLATRTDQSERLAQNLALSLDRIRRPGIEAGIDHLVRGFRILTEEGVPAVDLLDLLGGTLDVLSNLDADLIKSLDDHRMYADVLDVTELQELHAKAKARADARLPNPTGPALALALADSLAEVRR